MRFWCKFGATLYRAILTISNGVVKTRRYNCYYLQTPEIIAISGVLSFCLPQFCHKFYFVSSKAENTALTPIFMGRVLVYDNGKNYGNIITAITKKEFWVV